MSQRPLEGITVVAVEQAVAAPLCTSRLVDAGARVIKIERPEGDFARRYDDAVGGDSSYFAWANHGKESVALDFKSPDDAELLSRIIAASDVFVQNLAPGALERAGFGSATLRAKHPRLITCDVSGYGESPELAAKKAYDLLVQAESGLISISGGPGELGRIGVSICDVGTGITAYSAILEALVKRGVTGVGSEIKVSLFDVAAEWMTVPLAQHEGGVGTPQRVGLKHPTIAPYGAFTTSEGELTLISIQNEREWQRLCEQVLLNPAFVDDPRFGSNADRVAHRSELEAEMAQIIGQLDKTVFQQRLTDASLAFGSVNNVSGLADHPALRRRTVVSSHGAEVTIPAHPVRVGVDDPSLLDPPSNMVPPIGGHSEQIRAEFSSPNIENWASG